MKIALPKNTSMKICLYGSFGRMYSMCVDCAHIVENQMCGTQHETQLAVTTIPNMKCRWFHNM